MQVKLLHLKNANFQVVAYIDVSTKLYEIGYRLARFVVLINENS